MSFLPLSSPIEPSTGQAISGGQFNTGGGYKILALEPKGLNLKPNYTTV